ncbi:hypothetical protein V6N11_017334 [Hibiscus sabdariffa]|uniref:Uncharacterized protein n=1 Tax=Hibiscus sabdariffa TaxID=183260 RepID=A0ABR2TY07_9ROSI
MHDLICGVSHSIASKHNGMWVIKDGNHLKESLKGNLKGCTAILVPHSNIPELSGIIGNSKTLDVLSFKGFSIEELLEEIAELTRLKLLDFSGCQELEVIPANVIAELHRFMGIIVHGSSRNS